MRAATRPGGPPISAAGSGSSPRAGAHSPRQVDGRWKGYRHLTVLWLAGLTLFHLWYVASGAVDLAPDEAHYWEWSRRLDWSYYSKGPMVAYLIASATRLGGNTEFFVRLPAVLLALGTGVLVSVLARDLFASERAGFLAVLTCGVMPLYAVGSILMTIDAPLVFFWALALFALRRALAGPADGRSRGERARLGWWFLFALALGLGFQSKYTMLLVVPCLWGYLLISPSARASVAKPQPYLSVLLGLLISAPVLVWNARHQWVSFRHVLGLAGLSEGAGQLSAKTFLEFLGSQVGVVSPLLFCAMLVAMIHAGRRGLQEKIDAHLFLFLFSAPLLAFFLLWSIHEKVEGNWAAPAYLAGAISLAGFWEERLQGTPGRAAGRRLAGVVALVLLPGLVLDAVAHFPGALGHLGIDIPSRIDMTRRLHGWKELGLALGRTLQEVEGKEVFLMSDRYQIASELAFYVPGQPRVYNINLGRRMNQYDIWGGLGALRGRDAFFVIDGEWDAPPSVREACDTIRKVQVVKTFQRGQPGQRFAIFRCGRYRGLVAPEGKVTY